jgi:hypothetical protein
MSFQSKCRVALIVAIVAVLTASTGQRISAQDVFHAMKGVVKSVDKDSKTMVVKASDGTEHTIKWTDKTTMAGGKDGGKGLQRVVRFLLSTPKRAERKLPWE